MEERRKKDFPKVSGRELLQVVGRDLARMERGAVTLQPLDTARSTTPLNYGKKPNLTGITACFGIEVAALIALFIVSLLGVGVRFWWDEKFRVLLLLTLFIACALLFTAWLLISSVGFYSNIGSSDVPIIRELTVFMLAWVGAICFLVVLAVFSFILVQASFEDSPRVVGMAGIVIGVLTGVSALCAVILTALNPIQGGFDTFVFDASDLLLAMTSLLLVLAVIVVFVVLMREEFLGSVQTVGIYAGCVLRDWCSFSR